MRYVCVSIWWFKLGIFNILWLNHVWKVGICSSTSDGSNFGSIWCDVWTSFIGLMSLNTLCELELNCCLVTALTTRWDAAGFIWFGSAGGWLTTLYVRFPVISESFRCSNAREKKTNRNPFWGFTSWEKRNKQPNQSQSGAVIPITLKSRKLRKTPDPERWGYKEEEVTGMKDQFYLILF